jgi:hypothetical protein
VSAQETEFFIVTVVRTSNATVLPTAWKYMLPPSSGSTVKMTAACTYETLATLHTSTRFKHPRADINIKDTAVTTRVDTDLHNRSLMALSFMGIFVDQSSRIQSQIQLVLERHNKHTINASKHYELKCHVLFCPDKSTAQYH